MKSELAGRMSETTSGTGAKDSLSKASGRTPTAMEASGRTPTAMAVESDARNRRRLIRGVVKSTKMQKTITVAWQRQVRHAKFGKFVTRVTNLHAHDENSTAKVGDFVEIMQTRPLSKTKRWRLVKVVREAAAAR